MIIDSNIQVIYTSHHTRTPLRACLDMNALIIYHTFWRVITSANQQEEGPLPPSIHPITTKHNLLSESVAPLSSDTYFCDYRHY